MNYIGSKHRLSKFIKTTIKDTVGNLEKMTLCDLFAGTGIIGRAFKNDVAQVMANDIEPYSYILNKNYIGNNENLDYKELIDDLNNVKPKSGLIYKHYCLGSGSQRNYFSDENGQKIDAIRKKINLWQQKKIINKNQYYFLLASLLESADKVANTASVYAAFLKNLKKTASKELIIAPAHFECSKNINKVYKRDANKLIKNITGDILYLDPPYNIRQYGGYYHILNTIAEYKKITPKGITGMPIYFKSDYCKKNKAAKALAALIKSAKFKYIFLSYNNEGIMNAETIKNIMESYGIYSLATKINKRFNTHKKSHPKTIEYLHILTK